MPLNKITADSIADGTIIATDLTTATGGTGGPVTSSGGYTIHTFTSSGTYNA